MAGCLGPLTLLQSLLHDPGLSEKCEALLNAPVHATRFQLAGYLEAFSVTCVLELPFYLSATRGRRAFERFRVLLLANLATHPMIYFGLPWFFAAAQWSESSYIASAEMFAPVVEGCLLCFAWKVPARRAFPLMLLANLFSWAIGSAGIAWFSGF